MTQAAIWTSYWVWTGINEGLREEIFSYRAITGRVERNDPTLEVGNIKEPDESEIWQWMTECYVNIGWQKPHSHGSGALYNLIWTVHRTLEHFCKCVIICCTVVCMQRFLCTEFSLRKTTDYNGLIEMNPGLSIGNNSSFPLNQALIWGAEMNAFSLDAVPVNATFHHRHPMWYWTNAKRDGLRHCWTSCTTSEDKYCGQFKPQ